MRKKPKRKLNKLALGGALIMSALFISSISINFVSSYDQQNTHPALTDEAVDFYNLNFPNNPLTQEDKDLLIRGAVEEDTPPRWLNHFYDPIYNQGWSGYTSSKKWAVSSTTQQAFTDSAYSYSGFANLFSDGLSPTDFSYERALHDYAVGNRKRAMLAMGHVIHLLEDSNVPEHTRGDTHLPWHGTESPYEKTMAKWNPSNVDIAAGLFKKSKKSVLLNQLGDYFDEIAKYSNGYFFSEDTIFTTKYSDPKIDFWKYEKVNDELIAFGYKTDRIGKYILVKKLGKSQIRNLATKAYFTLDDDRILDDYWSRLSTDFVIHGAGALKLFLDQAEMVKKKYSERQSVRVSYGWIGNFLGLFGFSGGGDGPIAFDPDLIELIISQPIVLNGNTQDIVTSTDDASNDANSANDVGTVPILLALSPTPLAPSPTPSPTPATTSLASLPINLGITANGNDSPTPSLTPLFTSATFGGLSGGSGGSGGTTTPTPIPLLTATPTPTPSLSPTPTPTPTPLPTELPTPTPTLTPSPTTPIPNPMPIGQIIINEIAWMGTGGTATLSSDEWLELYNPTSSPVNVGGWRLMSLTDNSPNIILASKTIDPYGFFLLERTNDVTISGVSADQIYTGNLNDTGEILELLDNHGNLQDLVSKSNNGGWYAGDRVSRSSMERINPLEPGSNLLNWANNNGLIRNGKNAAGDFIDGTPRTRNSVYISQKPTAVNDLAVDPISFFGRIKLIWSAPKDDDTPAGQLKYDLRYAIHSFDTITDWDIGAKVATSSMPTVVASFANLQSASFPIFDYNADYYFALKTTDGQSKSEISNQPKYTIKSAISGNPALPRGPARPAIAWRFQVPGAFYLNQPVVALDGTIYFGTPNNQTNKPRLYALNPDGTEKWHFEEQYSSMPSTPAVSDDGAVYFGHLSGPGVYALNPEDGTLRWQYDTSRVNGVSVDEDGNVYATSDNKMINKIGPNGNKKWQVLDSFAFGFNPIAVPGDKDIYLAVDWTGLPGFYRLNGEDGVPVWQNRISDSYQYQAFDPVYDKATDKFYTATTAGHIISVNRSDGAIDSHLFAFGVSATTKVAIIDELLTFGVDFSLQNQASGQAVLALNKADKSKAWTFPVDSRVNKQIAVDADGNLYFAIRSGKVYSLDKNGQERWIVDIGIATDTYPVLGNNAVFIGAGGKLFKIGD